MKSNDPVPSADLYLKIRAAFVAQGTTLGTWCRQHEINPTNAKSALIGSWNGPKAQQLRRDLIKASGLQRTAALFS